jgi:hypothetical protein
MAITDHQLPDAEEFARMEEELFGRLERSHTRQVRRHRLVAAASIVLLAGGGVAAVQVANSTAVSHSAYCYATADAGSQSAQVALPVDEVKVNGSSLQHAGISAAANLAVQHCLIVWNSGYFDAGSTSGQTSDPKLQACVRNDQVIAVFPKTLGGSADQFCANLGMSAP